MINACSSSPRASNYYTQAKEDCREILELGLGLVVDLSGLELVEKRVHGDGVIV